MKWFLVALPLVALGLVGAYLLRTNLVSDDAVGIVPIENVDPGYKFESICGWIPAWDVEKGLFDAKRVESIDCISPMIFVLTKEGNIDVHADFLAKVKTFEQGKKVEIIPTIENEFDGERISKVINSDELIQKHVAEITNLLVKNNLEGIDLDYEYIKAEDKDVYSKFVSLLAESLHAKKKILVVTVHAKTNDQGSWYAAKAQDWAAISASADRVRVMIYDYSSSESTAGPIAPLPWFKDVVTYAQSAVPADKLVVGIGFYGYDWEDGSKKGASITLSSAAKIAENNNIQIKIDRKTDSAHFNYKVDNKIHEVWFETAKTLQDKVNLLKSLKVQRIAIWRLEGVSGLDNFSF